VDEYIVFLLMLLTYLLTELSLLEKLPIVQPFRKFPAILRNLKVHHRVHKSLPLVPILNQFDPVPTIQSYFYSCYSALVTTDFFGGINIPK
jgi:hypothetical protein